MVKINNFGITHLKIGFYVIEDLSRVGERVLAYEKSLRVAISRVNEYLMRYGH